MNTPHAQAAPARPSSAAEGLGPVTARLFRASLAQGRLHPLYLPVLNYRSARPEPAAGAS